MPPQFRRPAPREAGRSGWGGRPGAWARAAGAAALALRLVALAKPPEAAQEARGKARQAARKGGHQITPETLYAAGWVILVTSLSADCFSSQDVGALYRLRWRDRKS